MNARDSLVCLRLHRKRADSCHEDEPEQVDIYQPSKMPLEELREQVARKRQKVMTSPFKIVDPNVIKRTVLFDLSRNEYKESRIVYEEETPADTWLTAEEAYEVKLNLIQTAEKYMQGIPLREDDCLRGLEVHVNPILRQSRMRNGRNHILLILQQQHLSKVNSGEMDHQLLSRMSSMLSAENTEEARLVGIRDAREALDIYSCDMIHQVIPTAKATANVLSGESEFMDERVATRELLLQPLV